MEARFKRDVTSPHIRFAKAAAEADRQHRVVALAAITAGDASALVAAMVNYQARITSITRTWRREIRLARLAASRPAARRRIAS